MVYAVLLPQGLCEKGGGRSFKEEVLFQTMVRECCELRGNIVTIAYCDDGMPDDD